MESNENKQSQSGFLCPVCGKYDFKRIGTFDICPFCNWENDNVQSSDHNYSGGANNLSVNESRIEFFLLSHAGTRDKAKALRDIYEESCMGIRHKYYFNGGVRDILKVDDEQKDFKLARQEYLNSLNEILLELIETR